MVQLLIDFYHYLCAGKIKNRASGDFWFCAL